MAKGKRTQNPRGEMMQGPGGMFASAFKRQEQKPKKKRNPLKDANFVDYLDIKTLERFVNDQGKILPRRITGVSAQQQRLVTRAVKYARHLALLPFVAQDIN